MLARIFWPDREPALRPIRGEKIEPPEEKRAAGSASGDPFGTWLSHYKHKTLAEPAARSTIMRAASRFFRYNLRQKRVG